MRSINILFALSFLFAITTTLPLSTAKAKAKAKVVLDTNGYPVRNGGAYYILPVSTEDDPDLSGGIGLTQTWDDMCPLTIVHSLFGGNGLPTIIESSSIGNIKEGVALNLSFSANDVPSCSPVPPRWSIVYASGRLTVKLADADFIQQPEYFSIEKVNYNNYKLRFISFATHVSGDIGIYIDDNGIRRLVLTTEKTGFLVQFQLANSSHDARRMKEEGKIELPHSG